MTHTEQQVRVAARMYETRDAVKRLAGDDWPKRFADYERIIRGVMAERQCNEIQAALAIIKNAKADGVDLGWTGAELTAAAVEMVEPT